MKIREISIESFGKLSNFTLTPGQGLTLIEGENESGKSTLLAFLQFVFYGFPRKTATGDGEEREKRISWSAMRAAGSVDVEKGGKRYRIFRKCVPQGRSFSEQCSVIRLEDNSLLDPGESTPGEYFFGLPVQLYDGSLSLVQSGADRVGAAGMGKAVGEHIFSGETALSEMAVKTRLEDARRELQHIRGRGGRIAELEDSYAALTAELQTAREDGERLSRLHEDVLRYEGELRRQRETLEGVKAALSQSETLRTLALFDKLTEAKAEEARCRAHLETLGETAAAELPDRAFTETVTRLLREMTAAQDKIEQLRPEQNRLSAVRYDEKLLQGAKRLREEPAEEILTRVQKQSKTGKTATVIGVILLLAGILCAGMGLFLPDIMLLLLAAGGAALAVAVGLLCVGVSNKHKAKEQLRELGAANAAMLRTYLEQCKREEAAFAGHQAQVGGLNAALQEAQEAERGAHEALCEAFAAIGAPEAAATAETALRFLEQLAARRQELHGAMNTATAAMERATGVTAALTQSLEGVDEAALRASLARVPEEGDEETLRRKKAFLEETLSGLERKYKEAEQNEAVLAATARNVGELEGRQELLRAELQSARDRLAALQMALEALSLASEELRESLLPQLQGETARIFHQLTGGVHGALSMDADFAVTILSDGIPRPLGHFSAGCRDAAHLSLRLALLGRVSEDPLPLFFDEAFARLDDTRTGYLMALLQNYCREGGQCILLTCHQRERRLLANDPTVVFAHM